MCIEPIQIIRLKGTELLHFIATRTFKSCDIYSRILQQACYNEEDLNDTTGVRVYKQIVVHSFTYWFSNKKGTHVLHSQLGSPVVIYSRLIFQHEFAVLLHFCPLGLTAAAAAFLWLQLASCVVSEANLKKKKKGWPQKKLNIPRTTQAMTRKRLNLPYGPCHYDIYIILSSHCLQIMISIALRRLLQRRPPLHVLSTLPILLQKSLSEKNIPCLLRRKAYSY